jgi:hypothetical protein
MNQQVKQHRFLKYLWLLHTPKKLIQSHLLRPGSGSGSGRNTGFFLFVIIFITQNQKKKNVRPDVNFYSFTFFWHGVLYSRVGAGARTASKL